MTEYNFKIILWNIPIMSKILSTKLDKSELLRNLNSEDSTIIKLTIDILASENPKYDTNQLRAFFNLYGGGVGNEQRKVVIDEQ